MKQKQKAYDEISVEIAGRSFVGRRMIEGTRTLWQTIYYGELSKADGRSYSPQQRGSMAVAAKIILRELIEEAGDYPN